MCARWVQKARPGTYVYTHKTESTYHEACRHGTGRHESLPVRGSRTRRFIFRSRPACPAAPCGVCRLVIQSRAQRSGAGQEQDGTPPARGLARARTVRDESITGVRPTPTCRSFTTTIGGEAGRRAASTSALVGRLVAAPASPADHVAAAPNESGQRRMTQPCPPCFACFAALSI